jgi:anti-sigma-K factor RskA
MTIPTDRDAREELLTRHVLGDLTPAEAEDLRAALARDPALAAEVASLRAAFDALPYDSVTAPPSHLRARVLQALEAPAAAEPARARLVTWQRVVGAIAAVLVLALGFENERLRRELALHRDVMSTLQQPNVVLSFSLAGLGSGAGAFGNVVLDLDAKKAAVVIRDLPPNTPDQVYRLWAQIDDRKVPCGNLTTNADGTVLAQLPIPVDAYTSPVRQLLLTREAVSNDPEPRGPIIMRSS